MSDRALPPEPTTVVPAPLSLQSKAARHAAIAQALHKSVVRSQSELQELLAAEGIQVTQATLSRDLEELQATKARDENGLLRYTVGSGRNPHDPTPAPIPGTLQRWCSELMTGAKQAANQVVLRTPPGAAGALAAVIDKQYFPSVLGCIAGDDTILVICSSASAAVNMQELLLSLAAGNPAGGETANSDPDQIG